MPGGLVDLLDRHTRATRRRRRWSRRWPRPAPSAATRRRSARAAYREAAAGWMARRLGVDVDPRARGGLRRHQGARGRRAAVAAPAATRPRHRAVPGISYPTYAMGATLAGCRAVPVRATLDDDRPRRRRPGAVPLGERRPATPPASSATSARRRPGAAPTACPCSPTSATWSSPGTGRPHDPRARRRRRARRALAVEALEPGRRPRRLLRRRPRPRPLPVARCASTPASWCPGPVQAAAVAALGDDAHVDEQRERYAPGSPDGRGAHRRGRCRRPAPAGAFYLWAPAPDGDAWALARRLAGQGGAVSPRRVLRPGRRRLRARRGRPARRPHRPRGGSPRCRLRPRPAVYEPPVVRPSGWWFADAGLAAAIGLVAGVTVIVRRHPVRRPGRRLRACVHARHPRGRDQRAGGLLDLPRVRRVLVRRRAPPTPMSR